MPTERDAMSIHSQNTREEEKKEQREKEILDYFRNEVVSVMDHVIEEGGVDEQGRFDFASFLHFLGGQFGGPGPLEVAAEDAKKLEKDFYFREFFDKLEKIICDAFVEKFGDISREDVIKEVLLAWVLSDKTWAHYTCPEGIIKPKE